LEHTHIGIWTQFVHDRAQMDLLRDTILGDEMDATLARNLQLMSEHYVGDARDDMTHDGGIPVIMAAGKQHDVLARLTRLEAGLAEVKAAVAALPAGATDPDAVAQKLWQLFTNKLAQPDPLP
jgi:hypothetical protein